MNSWKKNDWVQIVTGVYFSLDDVHLSTTPLPHLKLNYDTPQFRQIKDEIQSWWWQKIRIYKNHIIIFERQIVRFSLILEHVSHWLKILFLKCKDPELLTFFSSFSILYLCETWFSENKCLPIWGFRHHLLSWIRFRTK